jgi:hypothetical protein
MPQSQSGDTTAFPYATHLNILFQQLQEIDVPALAGQVKDQWYNQTLCKDRSITLAPLHGFTVPKGVIHRTRALERCVILMIENAGIVPTGD